MKTISFDFDDTIYNWYADCVNPDILAAINHHISAGDRVILVTSRHDITRPAVELALMTWDIPIKPEDVFFTGGLHKSWAFSALKAREVDPIIIDVHYDDNPDELASIEYRHKGVKLFQVLDGKIIPFRD